MKIARKMMLIASVIIISSCSRTIYVPVENTVQSKDSLVRTLWKADTLTVRDSVSTFVKGDSVVVERIRWKEHLREVRDTVVKNHIDSIYIEKPVPIEVVKEVNKPLPWWRKILIWLGALSLVLILLFAVNKFKKFIIC